MVSSPLKAASNVLMPFRGQDVRLIDGGHSNGAMDCIIIEIFCTFSFAFFGLVSKPLEVGSHESEGPEIGWGLCMWAQ